MQSGYVDERCETMLSAFVRKYWLLAVALHPLLRVLILVLPVPSAMDGIQVAERFLWASFWAVEAAVILVAARAGFQVVPSFRALNPAGQALAATWLVAMVIATVGATFFPPAFRSAAVWPLHGLFAMAVWHLATLDRTRFEKAFDRFTLVLSATTAAAGLLAVVAIYSIGLASDYPFASNVPGFSHIRHSGYIFGPAMALCLGRLATAPHEPRASILLFVLNAALCLWFGSRGPFFGLIAGLAVAVALFADFRRIAFWMRSASAAVAGAVLSVAVPSPDHAAFNAIRRLWNGSRDPNEFTSGRIEHWLEAARMIVDRPLFGYGGEQYQYLSPVAANIYRHPHQFILQVVFDWGVIGGGAFLALLLLGATALLKRRQKASGGGRVATFGAACMLGYAALDGILFYPFTVGIVALFMVSALALSGAGATGAIRRARSEALGAA